MSQDSRQKLYKPGEAVPETGIYKIYHRHHRLMHEAALLAGSIFPQCRKCSMAVRFFLERAVDDKFVLPFRATAFLEDYDGQRGFRLHKRIRRN